MRTKNIQILTSSTDVVFSEDDGGWYLQQFRNFGDESRVCEEIFPNQQEAIDAFDAGTVDWNEWN